MQPGMNVYRRFEADRSKIEEFYGQVLGLAQLPGFSLFDGKLVISRFKVGDRELKFTDVEDTLEYVKGPPEQVAGLRLLTLFFADEEALLKSFLEHGYSPPRFVKAPWEGQPARIAQVTDPDGQWVELVVLPNPKPGELNRMEIGVTVTELEKSKAFYRDFLGLKELAPMPDPFLETTRYRYRNGAGTVSLRCFGEDLPRDTGSAGIQYITGYADELPKLAELHNVNVTSGLSVRVGTMRNIWLADPDGVPNYFAETEQSREAWKRKGSAPGS